MGTLKEDIKVQSDWIVRAFLEDNIYLDGSIASFIEIDKFFNKHSMNGKAVRGGRLSSNLGPILFSFAAYVGNCLIENVEGAKWITDDNDPEGELNISVQFQDKSIVWPGQRVMKRFVNGSEDSIYVYGHELTKNFTGEAFDPKYWKLKERSSTWWKFW